MIPTNKLTVRFGSQTLFENINILSVSPNILLAVIIMCSVSLDFVPASAMGSFAGVLMDTMYGSVFGVRTITYMFLALFVSIAVDKKNDNSPLIMSWICFISITVMEISISVLKAMLIGGISIKYLISGIFVKGIFAALVALFYTLIRQYIKNRKARVSPSLKEELV